MGDGEIDELDPRQVARVVSQADKLVASGRLTPDGADRLRAATDHSSALQVLGDIRARHTSERLDAAVAEGAKSGRRRTTSASRSEAVGTRERCTRIWPGSG